MDQTKNTVSIFDKLATVYQDRFMDVSLYHESLDVFCDNLPPDAQVLELACGPGNITKYLLQKRSDLQIIGTDLAPNMIELAKMNNPAAHFQLLDCRDVGKMDSKFDAVLCGFGLPYLSKEEAIQFIQDAGEQLNPNGILYISTMEDDNGKSGLKTGSTGDSMYQNFHQADYLTQALKNNDFKSIDISRIEYLHNEQNTTDLIIIASK